MIKLSRLFFGFLLLFSLPAIAQVNDENLFRELKKKVQLDSYYDSLSVFKSGTKAIEIAQRLGNKSYEAEINIFYGNHFFYNHQLDKAEQYYRKSFALALAAENKVNQRLAKIRLAYLVQEHNDFKSAEQAFKDILIDARENNDYANQVECLNALALTHERYNKYDEALDLYLQALKIAEDQKLDHYAGIILNNIGLIKLNINKKEEALADFEKGLRIAQRENNLRLIGHLQNNIGLVYLSMDKIEEGLKNYKSNLVYARRIGHPKELAIAYINYGSALYESKKKNEALKYYDSALIVLRDNDMKIELAKGNLGKSNILIENGKYNEAISLLKSNLELCEATKNLNDYMFTYKLLHKVYTKNNNYKDALDAYTNYKELNDSLNDLQNQKRIDELQVQYDVEKNLVELEKEKSKSLLLEKENQLKKFRMRVIIAVSVVGLILTSLFFYLRYVRSLKKQQEKFSQMLLENTEAERSRIAKDLHDDIGQSLSAIKSKINLSKRSSGGDISELENEIGKVIEQTREISRNLYPSYLEKIGLIRSIARLSDLIQTSTSIECSYEVAEEVENLSIARKTHLYRIIQECINNTIKHSGASGLKINIEKHNDNFIFTYRDNGKGLTGNEIQKGLGYYSIKERSRMIGGDMQITDNHGKGFRLIIKFNANK